MSVNTNLAHIQKKIGQACEKSNRDPSEITIIGVTKYVTIERAKEVIAAGIDNIGENRSDELTEKHNAIGDVVKWHFIGTLQSRKVRDVIDKVTAIHSLDRKSLAKEINKRAHKPMDCFVQVNVSGEETKHGISPEEVIPFVESLKNYEQIRVVGLMTMAPHLSDKDQLRAVFRQLADLRETVIQREFEHAPCQYLSMGMSNDYHIAIEEGATHIRIGSQLVE